MDDWLREQMARIVPPTSTFVGLVIALPSFW
jgi:hypothetical protein